MSLDLIATTTLGANATQIDMASIPGTYTDLYITASIRDTYSGSDGWRDIDIKLNGVATSLSTKFLYGTGSGVGSGNHTSSIISWVDPANATANTFGSISMYIPNYAGSTNKSVSIDGVTENNSSSAFQFMVAGLRSNTAAITQVTFVSLTSNFVTGSTVSVYGILKGSGGATVSP